MINGIVIPTTALRRDNGRDVVFVASAGVAQRRAVNIGSQNEEEAVIIAGLTAGEWVVVEGPEELADGDAIEEAR